MNQLKQPIKSKINNGIILVKSDEIIGSLTNDKQVPIETTK